jgi:hypothetical protein
MITVFPAESRDILRANWEKNTMQPKEYSLAKAAFQRVKKAVRAEVEKHKHPKGDYTFDAPPPPDAGPDDAETMTVTLTRTLRWRVELALEADSLAGVAVAVSERGENLMDEKLLVPRFKATEPTFKPLKPGSKEGTYYFKVEDREHSAEQIAEMAIRDLISLATRPSGT